MRVKFTSTPALVSLYVAGSSETLAGKGRAEHSCQMKKSHRNYRHGLARWLHRMACLTGNFGSPTQFLNGGKGEKTTRAK
jgi:hypothetical protein